MADMLTKATETYQELMEKEDPRTSDWFMMSSPVPSFLICAAYFIIVQQGPNIMANRKPIDLKQTMLVYNFCMVMLSTYCFLEFALAGWVGGGYSFGCQPVDYSRSPQAMRMASVCWWFYISKFIELLDTIFFIMRKKFNQASFLHVFHHGIMPASWWFGVKFVPGNLLSNLATTSNLCCLLTTRFKSLRGQVVLDADYRELASQQFTDHVFGPWQWHMQLSLLAGGFGTFHAFLNSFIHLVMYTYYFLAALGPQYQKYLWWKKYMTKMQITQFLLVVIHSVQLLLIECNYPVIFVYWIGLYAVIFLVLFANFYIQAYRKPKKHSEKVENGSISHSNGKIKEN